MTEPSRIQLKRVKGWRMPPNTVKVDRSTKWGNPYVVGGNKRNIFAPLPRDNFEAVRWFYEALERLLVSHPSALAELRGKNLACWCPRDEPCHADALLELANRRD